MTNPTLTNWEPGDGLVCTYAKRSPIPCPFPTKTRIEETTYVSRHGTRERTRRVPLCENHAKSDPDKTPGAIVAKAHKVAIERLVCEHTTEYAKYRAEAIAALTARAAS